ncbi:hypothetical protein LBMAG40_02790 [Cyanobium sp.]|nr:hypothetical protein LBMAG40_02790 [Cyanobium sp.]
MINIKQFHAAVTSLMQLLPMSKQLTGSALTMAWDTFPERAKIDLTDEILLYAVRQRVLDTEPPKGMAPHIALLRYVYPVDRTIRRERGEDVISDQPMVQRGLRRDLAQRMATPDRFHEPGPVPQEQVLSEHLRLCAGQAHWNPSHMQPEELNAHVEQVAEEMRRIWDRGMDGFSWGAQQLATGRWWLDRALQGWWLLGCDGMGDHAAAWILRKPKQAAAMLEKAKAGALPPPAEVDVLPVGSVLGSLRGSNRNGGR